MDSNQKAFFALVRAGLWATDSGYTDSWNHEYTEAVNWHVVYQLAAEQSVQGLVLQGLEWYKEHKPKCVANLPKELLFQLIGDVQMIEQQNKSMNVFVAKIIDKLRKEDVYAILVKGQGIAQCYDRPLWRASGDVDLLLDANNYEKAKNFLLPLATDVETEYSHFKHQGMTIDGWVVELHGTFHSRLSMRVDKGIDEVQKDLFSNGSVRSWQNGKTQVFLPSPDNDVIFVFTHILHHFFFEGIGLRQICDWCRLLWTYRDSLNHGLLESRLRKMGLVTEWNAFATYAVSWLGMPVDAMPLYNANDNLNANKKKAEHINDFVLEVGNFGHKQRRDYGGMSYAKRKIVSSWGRLSDMLRHFKVFPKDSIVFFSGVLRSGFHAALRGE